MSVYLDHNASTPPHPEVLEAMREATGTAWANASSVHRFGQRARAELDRARAAVAALLELDARDVLLTSGGTEATNLALASICRRDGGLVTSAVEHPSVLRTAERLRESGIPVGIALPDHRGRVTVEAVDRAASALTSVALCAYLPAAGMASGQPSTPPRCDMRASPNSPNARRSIAT